MHRVTSLFLLLLTGLAGCFLGHDPDRPPPPTIDVDVAISAVSLAEDCSTRISEPIAGDCAPAPEEDEPAGPAEPGFAPPSDGCGSFPCQQSSVALSISADAEAPVPFRILRAELLDADGTPLLDLGTTNPRIFVDGEGYAEWNESIPTPSADLSVLYDLTNLDWSGIEDPYSRTYRVRLVVDVGGEQRTLTSEETTREAPIVT